MGKQSRKRQKTAKQDDIQPLGSHTFIEDTNKDDEERRLESMLFGVPYVEQQGDDTNILPVISDVEDGTPAPDLKELENMLDSDVCRLLRSPDPHSLTRAWSQAVFHR